MEREDDEMIELTVLGSHSPYAPANGACSGYLVEIDGFNIMMDCGNGTFSRLQKHIDFAKLNIVILTHLHPDHYSDIYCLRQAIGSAIKSGQREEPLFVYLPDAPTSIADEIRSWQDVFYTVSLEEALATEQDFNLFQLSFFKTKHSVPSYGVKISHNGQNMLVYTSDTGWYSELADHCRGAKLLLVEASLRDYELQDLGDVHLTAAQAGRLGHMAQVENMILTHFFPNHNLFQLQREAEQTFEGKVNLAKMGSKFQIEP